MSTQLCFPGFDRPATDRLFLAIRPDLPTIHRAESITTCLCGAHHLKGTVLLPHHLHVTLHWLGDYDGIHRGVVDKATKALSMLAEPPIEVTFDRAVTFRRREGRLPLVLHGGKGRPSLIAFHRSLTEAMARSGLRRIRRGFTPHMTLLYGDRSIEETAIEPVSWIASDVVLIHSKVRETKHTLLARWPLIAA